ncbi:MAG: hypothetical protein HN534_00665 [Euryarchaeota archaeon]|jgi:hypothetical protein|nr:hypothetical protein [Euryarchaeota archaeon]MBT3653434.1 hypothetical protein [Euryarchaeota archaeon]MBT3758302.1 hypothetical protein [Euryarchaeota archaeon]MBT4051411.1 hypothetical protein [Euryarchaeota archaeon]MBT4347123.1 hypothetical protein [Euryarchaeota archaeon]|tara:strand:- start:2056 stop:3006 length:951 start_codon:yes stop_codon:yes gene_type:complete
MTKKYQSIILIFVLFSSLSAGLTQAQPELGNWELGIEYPEDDSNNSFIISKTGQVSISFFVDNSQFVDIEVEFEYEIPFEGESSGPESEIISSGENKSFTLVVSNINVFEYAAESKDILKITANLVSRAGIAVIIPENQEKSADLKIPTIYSLEADILDPIGPMNAGTDMILRVNVVNVGNVKDRVGDLEISDNCPLLTLDNGLDSLMTTEINLGGTAMADLKITASESHPEKKCRIEIAVYSNGAMNAGSSEISEDDTTVTVEPPLSNPSTDPDEPEDPENPIEVVSSNLPAPGLFIVTIGIFGALIATKKKTIE